MGVPGKGVMIETDRVSGLILAMKRTVSRIVR
jgi:hypothetical protein